MSMPAINLEQTLLMQHPAAKVIGITTAAAAKKSTRPHPPTSHFRADAANGAYARFPPGTLIAVALPGEAIASQLLPSDHLLQTRALETSKRPITHCLHFYTKECCDRGARCFFAHVAAPVHAQPSRSLSVSLRSTLGDALATPPLTPLRPPWFDAGSVSSADSIIVFVDDDLACATWRSSETTTPSRTHLVHRPYDATPIPRPEHLR